MIKAEKGNVMIGGDLLDISAEFVTIVNAMIESGKFDENEIKHLVSIGFKSKEELHKEAEEAKKHISELIDKIFGKCDLEDDEPSPEPLDDNADEERVCSMVESLMRDIFGKGGKVDGRS